MSEIDRSVGCQRVETRLPVPGAEVSVGSLGQRRQVSAAAADASKGRWLLLVAGLYALFSTSRSMVRSLWTSAQIAASRHSSVERGAT